MEHQMVIHDVIQGSEEWKKLRIEGMFASELASAIGTEGKAKYLSRSQLLDAKKGWQKNPISSFMEKLFLGGHKHEELAREILEFELCENLLPIVATRVIEGIEIGASFDGFGDTVIWEHKDWNETLAENVRNRVLEPHYYWQLEQQLLVANRDCALFTVSDGTKENRVSMEYCFIPERRAKIIPAWRQFGRDFLEHQLEAKEEKVHARLVVMPSFSIEVQGTQIISNLEACLDEVMTLSEEESQKTLETDQDFADKDKLNKAVKTSRAELKAKVSQIKSEFETLANLETLAIELDSALQKLQSSGERLVKTEKEARKKAVFVAGHSEIAFCIEKSNETLAPYLINQITVINYNLESQAKGLKTIASIQNAVGGEVARIKTLILESEHIAIKNISYLDKNKPFSFLFSGIEKSLSLDSDTFKSVVDSMIHEHKKEQEKIRAEAEEKAKEDADRRVAEAEARMKLEQENIQKEAERKAKEDADRRVAEAEEKIERDKQVHLNAEKKAHNDSIIENEVEQKDHAPKVSKIEAGPGQPKTVNAEIDQFFSGEAAQSMEKTTQSPGAIHRSQNETIEILTTAIIDVIELAENSEGVLGLHRNGDLATWEELKKSWLLSLSKAEALLNTQEKAANS